MNEEEKYKKLKDKIIIDFETVEDLYECHKYEIEDIDMYNEGKRTYLRNLDTKYKIYKELKDLLEEN